MSVPVVILAGGLATRLGKITQKIPKSLIEVAGKPFAIHQLELLQKNGFTEVVFCVGYLGEQIQTVIGNGDKWGMKVTYVFDEIAPARSTPVLLGTGGAIQHALPYLGESFMVMYGDTYLICNYSHIIETFQRSGKTGLMTVYHNTNRWDRSNVLFLNNKIIRYDKKNPTVEMEYIDFGLGILSANVFHSINRTPPYDLADVYQDLIKGDELAGYQVMDRFYEIGSPAGLEETRSYLGKKGIG